MYDCIYESMYVYVYIYHIKARQICGGGRGKAADARMCV